MDTPNMDTPSETPARESTVRLVTTTIDPRPAADGAAGGRATTEPLPLVFLTSLGGTRDLGEPFAALAEDGRRVLLVDHRGHGESPAPEADYSFSELAADVLVLLDREGIERAHLVGLSMGGTMALQVALDAPSRVASVTMLSSATRFGDARQWEERRATVAEGGTAALVDGIMARWLSEDFQDRHPEATARVREGILGTPDAGYRGCCAALRDVDLTDRLGEVSAPLLIVGGSEDPGNTADMVETLRTRAPQATAVTVIGAKHLVELETPELVVDLVSGHCARAER